MVGLLMTSHKSQAISTETILQLLANPHRREILRHLNDQNGPTDVEELTRTISADGGTDVPSNQDERRPQIDLYHTHLPKLADADLLEYDRESGTVVAHPNDDLQQLLEYVTANLE